MPTLSVGLWWYICYLNTDMYSSTITGLRNGEDDSWRETKAETEERVLVTRRRREAKEFHPLSWSFLLDHCSHQSWSLFLIFFPQYLFVLWMIPSYLSLFFLWDWIWKGLQRNGKSCRLRWINYLRPGLKRDMISAEEEEIILTFHSSLGNK